MEPLLVVLDLDETLIYATTAPSDEGLVRPPALHAGAYAVFTRPGLEAFLLGLEDFARVAVWTASSPAYARRIVGALARVVQVDDRTESFCLNYGNGVRVTPWYGSEEDDELPALLAYLRSLASKPDVRRIEKRGWRGR